MSKITQFRHKIDFFQTNFDLKTKILTLNYKNISNFAQKYTISTQNCLIFDESRLKNRNFDLKL